MLARVLAVQARYRNAGYAESVAVSTEIAADGRIAVHIEIRQRR